MSLAALSAAEVAVLAGYHEERRDAREAVAEFDTLRSVLEENAMLRTDMLARREGGRGAAAAEAAAELVNQSPPDEHNKIVTGKDTRTAALRDASAKVRSADLASAAAALTAALKAMRHPADVDGVGLGVLGAVGDRAAGSPPSPHRVHARARRQTPAGTAALGSHGPREAGAAAAPRGGAPARSGPADANTAHDVNDAPKYRHFPPTEAIVTRAAALSLGQTRRRGHEVAACVARVDETLRRHPWGRDLGGGNAGSANEGGPHGKGPRTTAGLPWARGAAPVTSPHRRSREVPVFGGASTIKKLTQPPHGEVQWGFMGVPPRDARRVDALGVDVVMVADAGAGGEGPRQPQLHRAHPPAITTPPAAYQRENAGVVLEADGDSAAVASPTLSPPRGTRSVSPPRDDAGPPLAAHACVPAARAAAAGNTAAVELGLDAPTRGDAAAASHPRRYDVAGAGVSLAVLHPAVAAGGGDDVASPTQTDPQGVGEVPPPPPPRWSDFVGLGGGIAGGRVAAAAAAAAPVRLGGVPSGTRGASSSPSRAMFNSVYSSIHKISPGSAGRAVGPSPVCVRTLSEPAVGGARQTGSPGGYSSALRSGTLDDGGGARAPTAAAAAAASASLFPSFKQLQRRWGQGARGGGLAGDGCPKEVSPTRPHPAAWDTSAVTCVHVAGSQQQAAPAAPPPPESARSGSVVSCCSLRLRDLPVGQFKAHT